MPTLPPLANHLLCGLMLAALAGCAGGPTETRQEPPPQRVTAATPASMPGNVSPGGSAASMEAALARLRVASQNMRSAIPTPRLAERPHSAPPVVAPPEPDDRPRPQRLPEVLGPTGRR